MTGLHTVDKTLHALQQYSFSQKQKSIANFQNGTLFFLLPFDPHYRPMIPPAAGYVSLFNVYWEN